MKVVLSTRNPHKLQEIAAILLPAAPDVVLVDLAAYPGAPEVDEDRDTFEGNAAKKAVELAHYTGEWTLADDSGLEVDALDGAPGVYSARYAGEPADYARNNTRLLAELREVADEARGAQFICVMALAAPGGQRVETVTGICRGRITRGLRGSGGFGYDPLFVPDGCALTFAELGAETKNRISHRARAVAAARDAWFRTHPHGF